MAAQARRRDVALWHHDTTLRLMRSLVFAAAGEPGALRSVDPDRFETVFHEWSPLFAPELIADGSFLSSPHTTLLDWACRQSLRNADPASYALYAWPRELRHATGVAGEFFLLNCNSPHPELAARVAMQFLSFPVQSLLARNGIGLPVLKAAAVDCLGASCRRDELFVEQTRHICANSAREQDFLHRLENATVKLTAARLDAGEFAQSIREEIELARGRYARSNAFLQNGGAAAIARIPASG